MLLRDFPPYQQRTAEEWRRYVFVMLEVVCGYACIPRWEWEQLGLTAAFIMGDNREWEYLDSFMCSISFRKKSHTPPIQFGDEMPEKPKRHEAKYVWKSMFAEFSTED